MKLKCHMAGFVAIFVAVVGLIEASFPDWQSEMEWGRYDPFEVLKLSIFLSMCLRCQETDK